MDPVSDPEPDDDCVDFPELLLDGLAELETVPEGLLVLETEVLIVAVLDDDGLSEEDPDALGDPEEELEDETDFVIVLEIVLEIVPNAVIDPDELVEPVAVFDPEAETVLDDVGCAVCVCVFDPEEDPEVLGEILTDPEFVTEPLPETVFVLETVIVGNPVFVTVLECV